MYNMKGLIYYQSIELIISMFLSVVKDCLDVQLEFFKVKKKNPHTCIVRSQNKSVLIFKKKKSMFICVYVSNYNSSHTLDIIKQSQYL